MSIKFNFIFFLTTSLLIFSSCSDDDNNGSTPPSPPSLPIQQYSNLHADQDVDYTTNPPTYSGEFIKFDFETGSTTTSETDWDIAFRGTTILVNGGDTTGISQEPLRTGSAAAYIYDGLFQDLTEVDESLLRNDDMYDGLAIPTGSGNGWYNYSSMVITPIAGKVLVFRTADNRFAKMEIISYYKDAPTDITNEIATTDNRYYTFNYTYQPEAGNNSF